MCYFPETVVYLSVFLWWMRFWCVIFENMGKWMISLIQQKQPQKEKDAKFRVLQVHSRS